MNHLFKYFIKLVMLWSLCNPTVNWAQTDIAQNHCYKYRRITLTLKNENVKRNGEFLGTLGHSIYFDQEKVGLFFNPEPKMYLFQEIASIQLADGTVLFDETVNLMVAECNEFVETDIKNQKKTSERIFYTQLGLGTAYFLAPGSDVRPGVLLGTALETIKTTALASIWNLTFSLSRTHVENTPIRQYDGSIQRYLIKFNFFYLSLTYHLGLHPVRNKNIQLFFGPSLDIALGEFSAIAKSGSQTEEINTARDFHLVEDPGPESMDILINSGFGFQMGVSHRSEFAKVELRYSLNRPEVARPAFSNSRNGYSTIGIDHYLHHVWLIWNFEL